MLIPLIKLDTNKGSLYYTDDHTAYYAAVSNWKTPDNCSWNGRRITYVKILLLISIVLNDLELCQDMAISLSRCTQAILSSLSNKNRI
jgi:hypothetical protein